MRSRPVIPIIGRRVQVPWRLGDYAIEPGTAIAMSILLVHHREDVYPDPFAFRPERFLGRKPGTYDWIPFGGGIRRCLGAALAMAEQRVVLTTMARRLDLEAATPAPERAMHRNVTMIPAARRESRHRQEALSAKRPGDSRLRREAPSAKPTGRQPTTARTRTPNLQRVCGDLGQPGKDAGK